MAAATWQSVKLEAGCWPDIAPKKAKGFYRTANRVRFTPQLEPHRGWERVFNSGESYDGKARSIIEWADNNAYPLAAIGTHTSVWATFDGDCHHITPIEEYAYLSSAFSTTAASSTFTVTKTAHGYVAGMFIRFPASPTVDSVVLSAQYYTIATVTANSFTFNAGANASAGGTGLGGNIDMDVFLRPGNEFGTAGQGFGTGNYDVGLYGGTLASASYKARIWSGGSIGELLVMSPRGGGMYEFGPSFSATDLAERVTDGDFLLTAQFTYGTGWSRDAINNEADAATLTVGASLTSSIYQSVTIPSGRWCRLRFTVKNYSAGSLRAYIGSTALGSAAVAANSRNVIEFFNTTSTAQTLSFRPASANTTLSLDSVSLKVSDVLCRQTAAPAAILALMTSPQGHAIAMGCTNSSGNFDPMCVRNSDANDTADWTPSQSNEAREFFLRNGQFMQQGINAADGQIFMSSNRSLWECRYVGLPTVFDFVCRDPDCWPMGARGMVYADSRVWFPSIKKRFKVYDGKVTDVFCPGELTVFNNIAPSQEDLCEMHAHMFGEIWFIYPTVANASEVSNYAAMTTQDMKWQSFGTYGRTAWSSSSGAGNPLAAQDGQLYYHERGFAADGAADLDWSARAVGIEIGFGHTTGEVSGYRPDVANQMGPYNVRFLGYQKNAASTPQDSGNVPITSSTQEVQSFFVEGSILEIELSGDTFVQIGDPRYLLRDTENAS